MKLLEVKVRPIPNGGEKLKGASRVYVNKDALIDLTGGLDSGKPCLIELSSGQRREATLWPSLDGQIGRAVAQMSKVFQEAAGLKLGDQCKILYGGGGTVPDGQEIVVKEVSTQEDGSPLKSDLNHWAYSIASYMEDKEHVDHVFPGMILKNIYCRGPRRSFKVVSVNGKTQAIVKFMPESTRVIISSKSLEGLSNGVSPTKLEVTDVVGLDPQVEELNQFLFGFGRRMAFQKARVRQSCGLVIHGGHGSGKSMLLSKIEETAWGSIHRIGPDEKLSTIREILQEARAEQPSIVTVDGFEQLIDKERSNYKSVIRAFEDFLKSLSDEMAEKGEQPRIVVLFTCLDYLTDIPLGLRQPGLLMGNIYLPYPDRYARRKILESFNLPIHPDQKEALVKDLSERTHAFNGQDLSRLGAAAVYRGRLHFQTTGHICEDDCNDHYLPQEFFEQALVKTVPSAMDGVKTNAPPIYWDDIGGQEGVKTSLRRAIKMSRQSQDELKSLIGNPPKGFLLYGPPGCSKTMAAQAMATESGLNFFAIKGAELIDKYVGESERAIRRLFERARNAAPSMIFFDEIDSIAGQRKGFGTGGGEGTTSHGGLNVLTTLLNEMDGFEPMRGVLVLAATNRPQALDPALVRPGRFDALIYVAPPDRAAREAIFRRTARSRRVAPDIDMAEMAGLTDGYSGAEVAAIFQTAGLSAWERGNRDAEAEAKTDLVIQKEDMLTAIKGQRKQITAEMVRGYEAWESEFGHHF